MAERCSWCNTDPDEAAARFEGPHATWCVHYSHAVAKQPKVWLVESNPGLPPDPRDADRVSGNRIGEGTPERQSPESVTGTNRAADQPEPRVKGDS